MSITTNGRLPRKQLADQLDRFDSILDGLSDALNEAVADAAREGARSAVKEILSEMVKNPQFAGLFQPVKPVPQVQEQPVVPPTKKPSLWSRMKRVASMVVTGEKTMVQRVAGGIRQRLTRVSTTVRRTVKPIMSLLHLLRLTGSLTKTLWIATGIGLVIGIVSAFGPHWLSATVTAITTTSTAFVVQVGIALKSLIERFKLS